MSRAVLAEFRDAGALMRAAQLLSAKHRLIDAYSPVPLEEFAGLIAAPASPLRIAMFVGGFGVAACAYALEWYSATIDYPIDSGGRPLHSWAAFMMFPFSVGILSAAICGLIAFLVMTGLPRLHHPLFDAAEFDRVNQDTFALQFALPLEDEQCARLFESLRDMGATSLREVAA